MKRLVLYVVIAVFLAISVIFWGITLTSGLPWAVYLSEVAQLLALTGFVLILFQYVLSSRIRLIERGIGLDRLFIVHRRLGVVGLAFVFFHPILLFVSETLQDYHTPYDLRKILGIIALVILCVAAGAAILYGRIRLKYETWKNIHRAGYAIFAVGFAHSLLIGSDTKALEFDYELEKYVFAPRPLGILWLLLACIYVFVLIYKLWNLSYVKRHPLEVTEVSQETRDVTSLYFEGEHRDYKPGQFLIVQLARNGKVSEPHPFTISSSPTQDRLSISVKSVGDFTSTISDTKTSDLAYIDAPYGVFSFLNYDAQDLVFIAGGIGITPFMSMLRYIYDRKLEKNVTLIWGNKTDGDIVFREELEKMSAEMPPLKIVHVMSKQDGWQGEKGYVDAELLKKYVSNFQEPEFFICGPPIMMSSVIRTLRELGVPKNRMHYERFALR